MWFLAIYGGAVWLMIFFCLPETLARRRSPAATTTTEPDHHHPLSRSTTAQSVRRHTRQSALFLKRAFVDPLAVLLFLRYPPIALTVYYASITCGALFVLNISTQAAFPAPPYSLSELDVGQLYLPASLGYRAASLAGGRWTDVIMAREARRAHRYDARGRLVYLPEDRMRENAWLAATLYPAALIWFGWTVDKGVIWVVPAIAQFFFGIGTMLVFGAATTMLTEFMPGRSSGGIALNNFVRNIFSCVGAVVTQPLIDAMGNGWLCTMFGILSFISGYVVIWALKRHGPAWRKEMNSHRHFS